VIGGVRTDISQSWSNALKKVQPYTWAYSSHGRVYAIKKRLQQ